MRQANMMGPAIDAIDHGIGSPLQLVVEAAFDQAADDGSIEAFASQDVVCRAAFDAAFRERAVQPLDDVAALAKFAQDRFGFGFDEPLPRTGLSGDAEHFQDRKSTRLNSSH